MLTNDSVEEVETLLGTRLPDAYIGRMKRQNGGWVEIDGEMWTLFPIRDTSSTRLLKKTFNDVARETETAREDERFPGLGVTIGENGSGDHLVLVPGSEGRQLLPAVFVWRLRGGELTRVADHVLELWETR